MSWREVMTDSNRLLNIQEWLALTEEEQCRRVDSWNPYIDEGQPLLNEIAEHLRRELSHLRDVTVNGLGIYHGGSWVIVVSHPYAFNRGQLPQRYLGVWLNLMYRGPISPEFNAEDS
jgi:hypothetical protein